MTDERKGNWIQTATGRQYWPLDPRPGEVRIRDIGHHLSHLCRYTGACLVFYSVAEHSVHVSRLVEAVRPAWALRALLHDAAEAYCNDIARPVKRSIVGYAEIEAANEREVYATYGIPPDAPDADVLIKDADNAMLMAEQAALMAPCEHRWRPENVPAHMVARAHGFGPFGLAPEAARLAFMRRFQELAA